MNWEALGAIGELLGAAGVIATLGYLAFQIRQNNRHLAQEAERTRSQSTREGFFALADNGELAAILVKDAQGEALNATEEFRANAWWMRTMVGFQTSFRQLPRSEVEPMTNVFRRWSETMQSYRKAWEVNRDAFRKDFVEFMEQTVFNR